MRKMALLICVLASAPSLYTQNGLRNVDFKNFAYPLSGPLLGHHNLQWLENLESGYSHRKAFRLVNGREQEDEKSGESGTESGRFAGFSFDSVQYADVTGDGEDDAIVVLAYHTGGTQQSDYIYIYSWENGAPTLRAYCFTGDRANSGLYRVFAEQGNLVVDLFDPQKASADCCSSGYVQTKYRWNKNRFIILGKPTRGAVTPPEAH